MIESFFSFLSLFRANDFVISISIRRAVRFNSSNVVDTVQCGEHESFMLSSKNTQNSLYPLCEEMKIVSSVSQVHSLLLKKHHNCPSNSLSGDGSESSFACGMRMRIRSVHIHGSNTVNRADITKSDAIRRYKNEDHEIAYIISMSEPTVATAAAEKKEAVPAYLRLLSENKKDVVVTPTRLAIPHNDPNFYDPTQRLFGCRCICADDTSVVHPDCRVHVPSSSVYESNTGCKRPSQLDPYRCIKIAFPNVKNAHELFARFFLLLPQRGLEILSITPSISFTPSTAVKARYVERLAEWKTKHAAYESELEKVKSALTALGKKSDAATTVTRSLRMHVWQR